MAEKQTNEMRCDMPKDYKLEDFEEDTFLDYRTKLGNAYFDMERKLNAMDEFRLRAKEHPRQISEDEEQQAQRFLEEMGSLLQSYFILFVGMSDD